MSGSRSHSVRRHFGRQMALLLLAALLGGLLQPLVPTPPVAAQSLSPSTAAPRAEVASQRPAPVVESAPALTAVQQTGLVNVAQGKKATQTNDNPFYLYPYPGGSPSKAVDGNTNGAFANGSVSVTQLAPTNWWQVDLGGVYPISKIDVWKRTDCCPDQLRDFYVFVSDTPFISDNLSTLLAQSNIGKYYTAGVPATTTSITVGRTGRYVRVMLTQQNYLTLAEVQVWSSQSTPITPANDPINLAEGKTASQVSTFSDARASRAVDGYVYGAYGAGSVTHTTGSAQEWWQVDLGGVYPIDTIDVWNRTDCCAERLNNFYVFVSDTPFPTNDHNQLRQITTIGSTFVAGIAAQRTSLPINRTGRYVRVALANSGVISLAEVQVWSNRRTPLVAAKEPVVVTRPGDRSAVLTWHRVAGASSYVVRRATSPTGTYTQLSPTVTQPLSGTLNNFAFSDTALTNGSTLYYTVTALNSAGATVGTSEVITARPSTTVLNPFAPLRASSFSASYGMRTVTDGVLGRAVLTGIDSGDNLTFSNVNFGAGANGAALHYAASGTTRGTLRLLTHPANQLLATFPISGTNGAWTQSTVLITRTQSIQSVYLTFTGEGGDNLRIDELLFSAPGPYDTATVKWDPNLVLLHKSMGITLASFAFDAASGTMLFTFNASTAQGQAQLAKLKAGSMIASDTNLDLGGPYGRVQQVVTLSATQAAVKVTATDYTQMIYGGNYDVGAAVQQAMTSALQSAVGTSALGPGYSAAGHSTTFPSNLTYYDGSSMTGGATASGGGAQFGAGRAAGLGARTAQGDVPAIGLPPEAKNSPKGTFHVTMDNAQFIYDEDGWGIELVNVKMNALGIQPANPLGPTTNPVAAQFGFGVLGGVGFDSLKLQILAQVQNGNIARNQMFTVKTGVTAKAHFQTKGLAVGLWFWELPDKWLKGINFVVPTMIGPIPCSMVFGVQGFVMTVGSGLMTIEKGYQVRLRPGEPLNQLIQVSDYGDTKLDFGQRVDSVSLGGFFIEPFLKLRVGTFGVLATNPAVADQVLRWVAFGTGIPYERLKKMEGFVVFTFTPRLYAMMLAQNWKDKDRPIFQIKACVGPVVKAEALPGFPLPMTFELRLEGPPFCLWHKNWLYYDMQVPSGVKVDATTSEATIAWGIPVNAERASIPYNLKFYGPFPYSEEGVRQVESTNIADALFNGATRRQCVLFRKPRSATDTIDIAYDGPCRANLSTKVKLPSELNSAVYVLRVVTEYRMIGWYTSTIEMIRDIASGGTLRWGIWSDKEIVVYRQSEIARFEVNGTRVYTDSATKLDAIEGTECDTAGTVARGMTLLASVAPADPALAEVTGATLEVDGVQVATQRMPSLDQNTWELITTPKLNLSVGAHSMAIVAQMRLKSGGSTYTSRSVATFKAQPKACGRAKPDEFYAVIYEGGVCAQQNTPFSTFDVLGNDDWTDVQLELVSAQGATKGTLQLAGNKQAVLYKPTSEGIDTFTYTIKDTKTQTVLAGNGSVIVNNRKATKQSDCGDGGGGGGAGGPGGGRGTITNWGDPHITTADGVHFDSHALGEFIYLRPKAGKTGITVQGRQQYYQAGRFPAITTALAFRIGNNTVEIRSNRSPYVLVNGNNPNKSTLDLGDSASLTIGTDIYQITSPALTILVQRKGNYLDSYVTLPLNNTLEGMWGTPNGSKADDMVLPSGAVMTDTMKLADGWRITDRTLSLFTYASGEGPQTFNIANTNMSQVPSAAALAPFVTQAQNLLTTTCDTGGVAPNPVRVNALALDLYIGTTANTLASQLCSYQLSGQITTTNPAGVPVVGAQVAITSAQTQSCTSFTDTQGRYRCTLPPLTGGAIPTLQVSVSGLSAQSFTFPSKARMGTTLTGTLNLSVARPTLRLTVRTVNENNVAMPNTVVELESSAFKKRLTTGADGTTSLTLTYEPGTTITYVNASPVYPARGYTAYKSVTLNTAGTVDATIDVKSLLLSTPVWRALGNNTVGNRFNSTSSDREIALGSDGTIYSIGSFDNGSTQGDQLVAHDRTGARKWLSATTFDANSSPVIGPDGTIYALGLIYPNAYLYAFYPDGSLRWRYKSPDNQYTVSHTPAVGADGTIYLVTGQGTYNVTTAFLHAINPSTGSPRWSTVLENVNPATSPVVGPDGAIYVLGRNLWVFNPDGTLRGTTNFTTRADGHLLIGSDNTIYVVAHGNGESTSPYTVAINANLTQRWAKDIGAFRATVIGTDGALYMTNYPGLIKINPATGDTIWSFTATAFVSPVVGSDGTIYLLTQESTSGLPTTSQLVGLNPNGTVKSRFRLDSASSRVLAMGAGGTIYAATYGENGSQAYDLWAIPTSSSGPATGWSSAWGNPQNSGRRMP
ncbi:MAG: hypothetical protein OHK0022_25620 [Roseiflexaceae bacterium]